MKTKTSMTGLALAGLTLSLQAETLVVSAEALDTAWSITLVAAYQVDDEIWITSDLERSGETAEEVISYPVDAVEVSLPSLMAKHVGDLDWVMSGRPLYLRREQVGDYDSTVGDGWVETEVAGWLFTRIYPYVWHPNLGWLYAVENQVVANRIPEEPNHFAGDIKRLSFLFHSFDYGWLWKSPYTESYYVYSQGAYLSVAEIVGN